MCVLHIKVPSFLLQCDLFEVYNVENIFSKVYQLLNLMLSEKGNSCNQSAAVHAIMIVAFQTLDNCQNNYS
jgi:hypothetical protein